MPHFASLGFGPSPAVTNRLEAASEKQPLSVQAAIGCCSKLSVQGITFRKLLAVSPIMSGMMFFCWASTWMCSSITPFTIIKVQRHGLSLHLRPPVFFFPTQSVLKEGDTRRLTQAWLPPPCALLSFHQCALVRSSSVPPRHWPTPGKLLHFMFLTPVGPAQRPSFCFPLSLWSCMKEVSPGRRVLQDSGVFCVCFPLGPGYPPRRSNRGFCRAALSGSLRKEIRGRRPSSMFGNLRLLRGHRLATNSCKSAPPYRPHPRLPSLPVLFLNFPDTRHNPAGVISVTSTETHLFPLAKIPRQVSAPFVP